MKRTFFVIITLLLILGFRLAAYDGDPIEDEATAPASTKTPTLSALSVEVAPTSPSPGAAVAVERIIEDVIVSPTPEEDILGWEVTSTPRLAGDPIAGEQIFASACNVCHSQVMISNEIITGRTDQELVEFIKLGGVPGEPKVMLPKGGNPALTDQNLFNIVAYLRTRPN